MIYSTVSAYYMIIFVIMLYVLYIYIIRKACYLQMRISCVYIYIYKEPLQFPSTCPNRPRLYIPYLMGGFNKFHPLRGLLFCVFFSQVIFTSSPFVGI